MRDHLRRKRLADKIARERLGQARGRSLGESLEGSAYGDAGGLGGFLDSITSPLSLRPFGSDNDLNDLVQSSSCREGSGSDYLELGGDTPGRLAPFLGPGSSGGGTGVGMAYGDTEELPSLRAKRETMIDLSFIKLGLVLRSNGFKVLNGVTGRCRPGRVTAIMGPSGAGKVPTPHTSLPAPRTAPPFDPPPPPDRRR